MGTRTRGTVQQIKLDGEYFWIKMDTTGLFYRSDYLLLVDEILDPKKSKQKLNVHQKIGRLKRIAPTEISDHGDGPGYGGG